MTIQEQYKFFIENCTSTPNSYKNYSDFKRICSTLAKIKSLEDFDIYSVTSVEEMESLIKSLSDDEDFINYNKIGANQYSNALKMYLRFLTAKRFFSNSSKDNSCSLDLKQSDLINDDNLITKVRESFTRFVHLINTHTTDFTNYIADFEKYINPLITASFPQFKNVFQIVNIDVFNGVITKLQEKNPDLKNVFADEYKGTRYAAFRTTKYYRSYLEILAFSDFRRNVDEQAGNSTELINASKEVQLNLPLQQIYYGAPGTGKSFTIDNLTDENNSVRITFHPDTDYSTFVGCYKPTMKEQSKGVLTPLNVLISISKKQSSTEQKVKFISEYAESIKAAVNDIKSTDNNFTDNQIFKNDDYFDWNSDTFYMNFLNEILEERSKRDDSKITYEFTPQAFTNAYVVAWKNLDKDFFLIIEEINRGNCAQIFGDIFQLLDRNEQGYSSYKITPDQDLANYIRKQLADTDIEEPDIKSGKKMQLPPNLHIWATMNTSDQSLFPIDSAFKRRWNWKYVPIDYNPLDKRSQQPLNWKFEVAGNLYSWGKFLEKINPEIYSITESSDKQMGYFFAKADPKTGIISEEVFLNKVLFYLWTDVFKDYDVSSEIFKNKKENRSFRFTDFFEDSEALANFIANCGLESEEIEPQNAEDEEKQSRSPYTSLSVSFPDGTRVKEDTIFASFRTAIEKIGLDRIADFAKAAPVKRKGLPIIDTQEQQVLLDAKYTYEQVGNYFVLSQIKNVSYRKFLEEASKALGMNLIVNLQ